MPASPHSSDSPVRPNSRPLVGIGFKVGSVCVFLAMSSLVKASGAFPAGELVFFRSLFAMVPILVFMVYSGQLPDGLRTAQPLGHLWRGFVGTCGMATAFFALTKLPLPEAVAINYATPLLIVVFSAIFLHERVRLYRWSAVSVGLVGVVIIIAPQLTVFSGGGSLNDTSIGVLVALSACVFGATAMILVRRLVLTERSATIVFYFSLTSTLISLLSAPFGWVLPTTEQFLLLSTAGIAGGIGQILLTESYRHADMSVVAPFEYSSLLLSIGVGYFIFSEVPTIATLIGGAVVIGSGIFIIFREHYLGLDRTKAREVTPP